MLGFSESFSSNYYCRFCRLEKSINRTKVNEESNALRNKENYERDLNLLDVGIREDCFLHELNNFHVTENISCDVMHDILEGICRYEIAQILYQFIYINKYFSLAELNNRIRYFNFPHNNNKPPAISKQHLLKNQIILSASEMCTLTKYLSLIIGDKIPEENYHWELYVLLYEIINMVFNKKVTKNDYILLKILIEEHHTLYIEHFGNLKPKHHFLLHYPSLLSLIGPLANVSSMRFEGRHRNFKQTANTSCNNKNILYTLAIKNQLNFCHRLINKKGLFNNIEFGIEDISFSKLSEEYRTFSKFVGCVDVDDYRAITWLKINSIFYKPGQVLHVNNDDFFPIFGTILFIIVNNEKVVYFILNLCKTVAYSRHYCAYQILEDFKIVCMQYNNVDNYPKQNFKYVKLNNTYVPFSNF